MQDYLEIKGFPYTVSGIRTVAVHNKIKPQIHWQSYRITVVFLLPTPLIKMIYHFAAGLFGAIRQKEEARLHSLKWMVSSLYQDLREIVGHLYLVIPFCNSRGFHMVADAIAHKILYNQNFQDDLNSFQNKPTKVAKFVSERFEEGINALSTLNRGHNTMIRVIEENRVQRQKLNDNSLKDYEEDFDKNAKWKKNYWKDNTTFKNDLKNLFEKWKLIESKINEADDNRGKATIKWYDYFDDCIEPLIKLKGKIKKETITLYHDNQATLRLLVGEGDNEKKRDLKGDERLKNFEKYYVKCVDDILDKIHKVNFNSLVNFDKS